MRVTASSLCLVLIVIWTAPVWARLSQVKSVRVWNAPERTRLVFDVTTPKPHRLFTLKNPHRLVIDLSNTRLKASLPQPTSQQPVFRGFRSGYRNKTDLRIVVDLKTAVKSQSFQLKPNKTYGYRLVVDLFRKKPYVSASPKPKKIRKHDRQEARELVIAIDAGHGGEDPGALGPRGTKEKRVVLAIAKRLERIVRKQPGMRPVMIRKGDYYLGLRSRMEKAREAKADLFVSIHADAVKKSKVRGASVYTLSQRGASSEAAKWLAAKENAADLVGGVKLGDKDNVLAKVLLDLSQTATLEASHEVARHVLRSLKRVGRVHKKAVQKARFVVLKSPDIPSILVETAFISNRSEEKKLRNPRYQQRLAQAVFRGIRQYFAANTPSNIRVAKNRHMITKGDTLSGIAQQYGVSMKQLRAANSLSSSRIRIGQILTIPSDS